jgi:hypothetical protein
MIKFLDQRGIFLIWIRAVVIHAEFYHRYPTIFFYEEKSPIVFGSDTGIIESFRIHEGFYTGTMIKILFLNSA